MLSKKENHRKERHTRIRKKIAGTPDQPRLCVHRSLKNFQASIVDDASGKVLHGKSTLAKELKDKVSFGGNVNAASALGEVFAKELIAKGIKKVRFDRGGYLYHGRVKAFAEAAREAGLEF